MLSCKPSVQLLSDGEVTAYLYCENDDGRHPTDESAFMPFILSAKEARNIRLIAPS
jgi:hypothetical protein